MNVFHVAIMLQLFSITVQYYFCKDSFFLNSISFCEEFETKKARSITPQAPLNIQ